MSTDTETIAGKQYIEKHIKNIESKQTIKPSLNRQTNQNYLTELFQKSFYVKELRAKQWKYINVIALFMYTKETFTNWGC